MKRKYSIKKPITILAAFFFFSQLVLAQADYRKLSSTILSKDSLFWTTYNNCDTTQFPNFFTADVEFYHDKGGLTLGRENLFQTFKKNLCSNSDFRLRREVIAGTMKVFPLQESDTIYGAILFGEHVFYINEKDKKERLDGKARFTHVWILKDSIWKMSRILSYDHGPASYINKRKEIKIPANSLNKFVGKYEGVKAGTLTIQRENDLLIVLNQNKKSMLYPETHNLFFMKERDLCFEFIKSGKNKDYKLLVRENGEIVDELTMGNGK
ncbi:MAG TPA: DUF4440 domain-containing protein [Chitinophagaceae bacterium]|nr:DUF4440 domain-containing protein [Chitinophagaceae bacterium]